MSDRAPMHDLHAELCLLGAVMVDNRLIETLAVDERDFDNPGNAAAWRVMGELSASGKAIDDVTLPHELERSGRLGLVGGLPGIARFLTSGGIPSHAEHYAAIIVERARAKRILLGSSAIQAAAWAGETADELEARLHDVAKVAAPAGSTCTTVPEMVKKRMRQLVESAAARERGEFLNGVPTGIRRLDTDCGGVQFGLATILAARPGMGKSSFAMEIALHAAETDGYDVHVFSLEDTESMYTDRLLSKRSGVPAMTIRKTEMSFLDMDNLKQAYLGMLGLENMRYENVSGIAAEELVRCVRRQRRSGRKLLVIVDYVQIMARPQWAKNAEDAIAQNINTLGDAARNDDDAYLVLSQLNRESAKRADPRPVLEDLRGSGELEQRAKAIWFMYRGSEYGPPVEGTDYHGAENRPSDYEWKRSTEIIVRKNSNGENNITIYCEWDGPTMRIRQRGKEQAHETR